MTPTRRRVLQMLSAAAAATLAPRARATLPTCSGGGGSALTSWVPAAGWGALGGPRKVLEIFLRGGPSFWGSFWWNDTLGAENGGTGDVDLPDTGDPDGNDWTSITQGVVPIERTWNAHTLGKATAPLFRGGPFVPRKLADYMRVIRVRHDLPPHEAAVPYAATGTTLGRPHQAGLGATIARHSIESCGGTGIRSLVLQTGTQSGDDLAANSAAATGLHGAAYRPPIVKVGDDDFLTALLRTNLTDTDGFKAFYRDRYEALLVPENASGPVRSAGWSAYRASLDTMIDQHVALHDLLADHAWELFSPLGDIDYLSNYTRTAIGAAVNLLTAGSLAHVAVIDGGVEDDYDTHSPTDPCTPAKIHSGNIWNVCDSLADHMSTILDEGILVLIHGEFGRMETDPDPVNGTEHHHKGYVNVVISDMLHTKTGFTGKVADPVGPFAPEYADSETTFTNTAGAPFPTGLTPTDVHAAVLSLAGISPWQPDVHEGDLDQSCTNGGNSANYVLKVP